MKTVPRRQRPTALKQFLFGVPYYPEHWTDEDRKDDVERMASAGVNTVRMAEFAWDLMEPKRNKFDFSLFEETIKLLGSRGIGTILCTPTAAPPRWLTKTKKAWLRVDADGRKMEHGSRQHCCTNNEEFRKECVRITHKLARHFKSNPNVIGWQTDNELFCHFSECHCKSCLRLFQQWLKKKYGGAAALNTAWGTSFWAQTYQDFHDIPFPYRDRPTHANPSQQLDYYRFLSAGLTDFQSLLVKEIRKANPNWWISHNGMFSHTDHWVFAEELDFYGIDIYPGFSARDEGGNEVEPSISSLKYQECRAASGNFVVLELEGGAGGQHPYILPTPRPGQMRLWAWQAVAHGADGLLHFRWRSCRFGAEIYWNGILDHDNIPRRRYLEFSQEGKELGRIGPRLLGTVSQAKVAILVQTDQEEAFNSMPLGLPAPWEQRKHIWRKLQSMHLPGGVVDASDLFDGLDVIFLPGFVLMDEDLAQRLHAFVLRGGILVASARTATRNRDNQVLPVTSPGWLGKTFGLGLEEWGAHDPLNFEWAGKTISASGVYEILKPLPDAKIKVLARWNSLPNRSPHASLNQPAITLNQIGKGKALYIGTYFGPDNSDQLVALSIALSGVEPLIKASPEVEATCRSNGQSHFLFLLNHGGTEQKALHVPKGKELVSLKPVEGDLVLPPYGVAVIECKNVRSEGLKSPRQKNR